MSTFYRLGVVVALVACVILAADSRIAFGQRIVIGGNQNDRDRDRDEDEDDDDDDENRDRDRDERAQTIERNVQQFFQPRQGGQRGQGRGDDIDQNFRRDNRQNQFQDRRFQQQPQNFGRPQENAQGGLRIGNWQGDRWQGSHDIEQWVRVFGGDQKPFSSQWYDEHPKAWGHDHDHDRNHDHVWVAATLPGVYSWLGWGDVPREFGVNIGNSARVDLSQYHDWYPLGVYSLMAGPGDMGTRIVQLAVDRHGHIAGNYYDMISDSNYSLSGEIGRQQQRVYFSLNKNKYVRFRVHISRLLRPYGAMIVQLPGGEQEWQFVRLED
jgi:hypothetical protein